MESAFLVTIDAPGAVPPARPLAIDAPTLGFAPEDRRSWAWTTPAGARVNVDAWAGVGAPSPWVDDGGRVAVLAGHVHPRGRTAGPPGTWASHVSALGPAPSAATIADRLVGVFAALVLDGEGRGWVGADPLGLRCLYNGSRGGRVAVASRAALVAGALGTPGRGDRAATWLAALGYHVGTATGYDAVDLLAPGAVVRIDDGEARVEVRHPFAEPPSPGTVEDAADVLVEEVGAGLRSALSIPARRHVLAITGGRDSRLLLAVALIHGLADELDLETVGPPDLPDVLVAERLAATFGLRHRSRFIGLRPEEPYPAIASRFVERTASLVNAWDLSTPGPDDEVRITGIGGEALRSFVPAGRLAEGGGDPIGRAFPRHRIARLGLLAPNLADEVHADLLDSIRHELGADATTFDRVHAHYAGHRLRCSRMGPRGEVDGAATTVQPLYSPAAIDAARSLTDTDRAHGVLFAEVMRRAAEALVREPFAGKGWSDHVEAHLASRPPGPAIERRASPAAPVVAQDGAPTPNAGADTLVRRLHAQGGDERLGFLRAAVVGASAERWDRLDRAAVDRSLDRWTELTGPERRELVGAVTGLVWRGGSETDPIVP